MNRSPISLLSRRQVLQAGAIGYLGLSLPRLLCVRPRDPRLPRMRASSSFWMADPAISICGI